MGLVQHLSHLMRRQPLHWLRELPRLRKDRAS